MGMDALGYDRVERIEDMKDQVQGNHIPCMKVKLQRSLGSTSSRQSLVVGGSVIQLFNLIFGS